MFTVPTFLITALLMGLVGGTHCIVMCAPLCGAMTLTKDGKIDLHKHLQFQLGRLISYALLGAIAATLIQFFSISAQYVSALKPLWSFFHALVFAWGLVLLMFARHPTWVESAGISLWNTVRPLAQRQGGLLLMGMAWALLPCGLLYSALLTASLSGTAINGALSMLLFALGSGVYILIAPWLSAKVSHHINLKRQNLGTRLAGLLLCFIGAYSLWHDVFDDFFAWCLS